MSSPYQAASSHGYRYSIMRPYYLLTPNPFEALKDRSIVKDSNLSGKVQRKGGLNDESKGLRDVLGVAYLP